MIWAVVLAAGESRRMGTQKLLLPYGEATVVEAVAEAARKSRVDRVLAVLGADADEVRRALERGTAASGGVRMGASAPDGYAAPTGPTARSVAFAVNEEYRSGMLSSVQAAFRALPSDAMAAVVLLGDQPFIAPRVIDAVVDAFRTSGRGIVVPVFGGRRGHPVLVDLKYRDEVLRLDPADGLRQLLRAHPEDIEEVEADDPAILRDLDTPSDYQEV
jgi:molybdenum cofactor cytidylyltransferase